MGGGVITDELINQTFSQGNMKLEIWTLTSQKFV
jgi:hypothetical protein